ncbi:hypothetical protein AVEN_232222-1, partial [Araneus ventricosus]
ALRPSGKASAPGPEGSRPETRFHRRSAKQGICDMLNHKQWPNARQPSAGAALKPGEGAPAEAQSPPTSENYEVRSKISLVLLQNGTLI